MNGDALILDADAPSAALGRLGAKGERLWQLSRLGLPVPAWLCVDAGLYAEVREEIQPLLEGLEPGDYARRGQTLLAERFPHERLQWQLSDRLDSERFYAVRPSLCDDSGQLFSAPLASWLQVPAAEITRHVLVCWQALFDPALLVWLHEQNLPHQALRLAVLVQEMIASEAAGLMFMANPVGALTEVVVNAAYGFGQGLSSGQVEADTYVYDRLSSQWTHGVASKRFQIGPAHFGGTERRLVPPERQARSVLDTEQCQTLLELGLHAQASEPSVLELEWALDAQGRFWLLLARALPGLPQGEDSWFDQRPLAESFPGLSSPLTFYWVKDFYAEALAGLARRLGTPDPQVASEDLCHLFGHLEGRIYAHLSAWSRLCALLPAHENSLRQLGSSLGLMPPTLTGHSPPAAWTLPLTLALRLLRLHPHLHADLQAFQNQLDHTGQAFWNQESQVLEPQALLRSFRQVRAEVLPAGELELLLEISTQAWLAAVRALLTRAGFTNAEALSNDLLCDAAGSESIEPVHSLLGLASEVRREPALRVFLESQRQHYDPAALENAYPAFMQLWLRHLDRYGDRALGELKLETVTLREDPRLMMQWILDYAASPLTTASLNTRERLLRHGAEARLQTESQLSPLLKPLLNLCMNQARRCLRARERHRLNKARAFGMVRRIFRRVGEQLQSHQLLEDSADVVWLSMTELETLVYGSGLQPESWIELIDQRRRQYQLWSQLSLPDRILCRGPVAQNTIPARRASGHSRRLLGLGCSPGLVSAEAVVIANPSEAKDLQGKILVAELTDPGWVFLMIQAAGLIVEKGNLHSHTASIGRELGIPTIVGVPEVTRRIHSGQMLTINGQTGEVELG